METLLGLGIGIVILGLVLGLALRTPRRRHRGDGGGGGYDATLAYTNEPSHDATHACHDGGSFDAGCSDGGGGGEA